MPKVKPLFTYGATLTEKFTNSILDEDTGLFAHDCRARENHPSSQALFAKHSGKLPRLKPEVVVNIIGLGVVTETNRYSIIAAPAEHVEL